MEEENKTTPTPEAEAAERPMKLAERLKTIMQAKGITPTALAAAVEVHASNLTGFMQGKKNPTLSTLDRLAAALDCPTWMLLNTPEEVLADLAAAGIIQKPEPESPQADEAEQAADDLPFKKEEAPQQATESPQEGRKFDLCTIDPQTGETRLYRLVKP